MTHTPGPWTTEGGGIRSECGLQSTLKSGRKVRFKVATCDDGDLETVKANARLIAAAPALLEALEWIASVTTNVSRGFTTAEINERANAAIAQAKGKP